MNDHVIKCLYFLMLNVKYFLRAVIYSTVTIGYSIFPLSSLLPAQTQTISRVQRVFEQHFQLNYSQLFEHTKISWIFV